MQWKPEELLSLTVHTAALSGVGGRQPADPGVPKDRSSRLHQLLPTERIEGKRYAPKRARVRTHTHVFIHPLILRYSQRLEAGVTSAASS